MYIPTGVRLYLGDSGGIITNFSMLHAGEISDNMINSVLWCQSASTRNFIGEWFFPSGVNVSAVDTIEDPLHVHYDQGQIGLLRDLGIGDEQGLYRCEIPDENNLNQNLWIAIYRTSIYNSFVNADPNGMRGCMI